jgi:hypothetical protein
MSIERQQRMNANVKEVHEVKIGAVLVDGDRSAIETHADVYFAFLFVVPG